MSGPLVQETHTDSEDYKPDSQQCDKLWLRRVVYRLLVAGQLIIATMIVLMLKPPGNMLVASIVQLSAVALGLSAILTMRVSRVRVTPALAQDAELVRHGPYRLIRHPMYTALVLFASSYIISDGSWLSVQLWMTLLLVLLTKVYYEEKELRAAFPQYENYASTTSRLIPFVW